MNAPTYTIARIIAANKQLGSGLFFDPAVMRMFNSVIESEVIQGPGGVYFVTSERMDVTDPKQYKVRRFDPETSRVRTEPLMTENPFSELATALDKARAQAQVPALAA
jgi:hypothetical protein